MNGVRFDLENSNVLNPFFQKEEIVKPGLLYEVLPDGRWAFYFDSSIISSFNTCEKLFWYRHHLRLRRKGPGGYAMTIGSWWSKVMEYFYQGLMAQQHSLQVLQPWYEKNIVNQEFMLRCAGKAWVDLKMNEWEAKDPKRFTKFGGKNAAIVMANRYYEAQASIDLNTFQIVAVEQGFGRRRECLIGESSQVLVFYIGKPDLVVYAKSDETLIPIDHKTIDYVRWDTQVKYKPHTQTAGYIFICNELARQLGYAKPVTKCIINVAARAEPTDNPRGGGKPRPRFVRVFPSYSVEELEEWKRETIGKAERLRRCYEEGFFPKREAYCHFYAGCEYRGIDSLSVGARDIAIKADYVQIEPWVPYEVEEEEESE